MTESRPLRIALTSYRSKPHCGGQGVYVKHLSAALVEHGHSVEVFSGPPYPDLDPRVSLTEVPSLDLFAEPDPWRIPRLSEFRSFADLQEFAIMCTAGFPEPRTFSRRVAPLLAARRHEFDVLHDNQTLGRGLLSLPSAGLPLVGTIHHPITMDRRLDLAVATGIRRLTLRRWYGFVGMQARVARRIPLHLTPSHNSASDAARDFKLDRTQLAVVPIGVDIDRFRPRGERVPGRIVAVSSADVPLKGLAVLLRALTLLPAGIDAELVVVSKPKAGGSTEKLVADLGLATRVRFVHGLTDVELAELMASAELMVVPSLYEGFSLPALEAMASGTPLIASDTASLPEVVGRDGTCGMLVPPGDERRLAEAIAALRADPARRAAMSRAARARAVERFSWAATAQATVEVYRTAIANHRREGCGMLTVDFDRFGLEADMRLLDLGCGQGRHTYEALRRGAEVVAVDLNESDLADVETMVAAMAEAGEIKPPAQPVTLRADACALPFDDSSFDRVIASEIMEHIPDDRAAIAEVVRVTRPGGLVAVTVPRYLPERVCWALSDEYHEVEGGHVRIYRGSDLVAALVGAGLELQDRHHAHALHSAYWWLKCAVGVSTENAATRAYHRLLVWDMMAAPMVTRRTEQLLNPVLGKSLVLYLRKP